MDDYDDHWEHEELVVDQRWADEEIEKMRKEKAKKKRVKKFDEIYMEQFDKENK